MLTRTGLLRTLRRRLADDAGVTLIELTVAGALLAVVVTSTTLFLVSSQRTERTVGDATRQQADAQLALERVSRAMRTATYPTGQQYFNSTMFTSIGNTDVSFFRPNPGTGVIELVRYYVSGGTLYRTVVQPDCTNTPCDYSGTPSPVYPTIGHVVNADPGACPAATTLTAAVTSTTATSLPVASAAGFAASGTYQIQVDSEIMTVTGGQGTATWTVTRGAGGTTAATHARGAGVYLVQSSPAMFRYWNADGSQVCPTTDVDKIVDIDRVQITAVVAPATSGRAAQTLDTSVQLRNWRP